MPIASALQAPRRTTHEQPSKQKRRKKKNEKFFYYTDCWHARVIAQDIATDHAFTCVSVDIDTGHIRIYTKGNNVTLHFVAHPSCECSGIEMIAANILVGISYFRASGDALAVTDAFESFRISTRESGLLVFRGERKAESSPE